MKYNMKYNENFILFIYDQDTCLQARLLNCFSRVVTQMTCYHTKIIKRWYYSATH